MDRQQARINFAKPDIGVEEADAVTRVLLSGNLAAGKVTAQFEKEFAEFVGVKYAIFTNSGTSALKMAYKYYGEQGYTRVYYPKNTFCATYSAAAETDMFYIPYSGNSGIVETLLGNNGIKVNMSYGGIKDFSNCHIEDSAHRIEPNDPLVGKIRIYSFYATKNMTTGQGGMLVTNDKDIYERCRLYWKDGLTTSSNDRLSGKGVVDYEVACMAGGYDGNDILASIGLVQLQKLPLFLKRRAEIVERYNKGFGQDWTGTCLYCVPVNDVSEVRKFREFMNDNGIATGYHYPGPHNWTKVSLPIYPSLTNKQVDYIISKAKEWYEENPLKG